MKTINAFSVVDCWWHGKQSVANDSAKLLYTSADVQNDVLSSSYRHATAFSID